MTQTLAQSISAPTSKMPYITTQDGTDIYYKDWGNKKGRPVVFCHGWPLSSDNWEIQMFFLAEKGYRVIAHDRRGFGRSSQPWTGNDMNTYADDLNQLLEKIDLKNVMLVGHSAGAGEVVRYLGRHGSDRVSKAVLVAAVTPLLLKTESNPDGIPLEYYDGFRAMMIKDRAQLMLDVPAGPFYGFNRPGAQTSQGLIESWWRQGMLAGFKNAHDCVAAFSETDFTEDLKKINVPVLLLHGDDDQVTPIGLTARKAVKLIKNATLKDFPGASHGLPNINAPEVNRELLSFLES